MKKILWQTRSPLVYASFESGKLINGANGGNAYDFHAASALKNNFKISIDKKTLLTEKENTIRYWAKVKSHYPKADVLIKEPYPMVFGNDSDASKNIAMIHHIDEEFFLKDFQHRWFFSRMKKKLLKMDLVVTVSKYWEKYLENLGCKKIKIIYNSFDPKDYVLADKEIKNFRSEFHFNREQPLIYIGNAHRPKGVYEVYEALRNKPYQLVMSGSKNNAADLPVKFLSLSRHDYLRLLHASDLVITLSTMVEGWNRIAHEALLCRTPVIGSGRGGMKELLEGAGQKIISDHTKLSAAIEEVLKNRNSFIEKGFEYVQQFNKTYFENEWIKTVSELIAE